MKKILTLLLLGLFMISFASAFDWDNETAAYYELDNTVGVVYDEILLNDGTNNGATRGVAGKIKNSFSFDGVNDNINFGDVLDIDNNAFSISMWFNTSSSGSYQQLIGKSDATAASSWEIRITNGNVLQANLYQGTSSDSITGSTTVTDGDWHHIVLTRPSSGGTIYLYLDNVSEGNTANNNRNTANAFDLKIGETHSGSFDYTGLIDEVGIWNRTLNSSEVSELYNSGNGLAYPSGNIPEIVLESPINDTTISDAGANFTVVSNNISLSNATWENITYFVWSNGTLFNATTLNLSGEVFNQTQFIDNFTLGEYEWNAEACYSNITSDYCISTTNNRTFSVSLFTIVEEVFVNDTISGTVENFSISIDLLPGFDLLSATFMYNGSEESPSITAQEGNRYILVSDFPIPIIPTDSNISFYWGLTFTGGVEINTTDRSQLVRAVLLDNCSTYTNQIFNISLYDEETKENINGSIEMIYTLLSFPSYNVINTLYYEVEGVSSTTICSGLNISEENLAYSAEIRYESDGYSAELYHIQRADLTSESQNISLYDLKENDTTIFRVTYQDSTFNFIEGAVIQLQRKYISEGIYETVEAPLTSNEGVSILHIDLDSVKYRATVVKNGVVLDEFDNLVFQCQSELTGECEQKLLGNIDPVNDRNLDVIRDFYYSDPVLNNNSITLSFSVPSGTPSSINILLEQRDQFGNVTLCNTTIISSAGSISCDYSEVLGDSYIDFYIYKNGQPIAKKTYIVYASDSLDWLDNNYIFILILLFSLVGMALTSPDWIIINGIITMVISGGLYLARGLDFIVGLGNIVWLIIAAIILISKMSKQEDR